MSGHEFNNGKCSVCGMSEPYATYMEKPCVPHDRPEDIGVVPIMTNVAEKFDAEREVDTLLAGPVEDLFVAAWKRDRNAVAKAGITLRGILVKCLNHAYQEGEFWKGVNNENDTIHRATDD